LLTAKILQLTARKSWYRQSRCLGDFDGLSPLKQISKLPQIESETLKISGILVNFRLSSPARTNAKPPYWKVSGDDSGYRYSSKSAKWQHCQIVSISVRPFFEDRQCSLLYH